MIRKILFYLFHFCLLGVLFACMDCKATVAVNDQNTEVKGKDSGFSHSLIQSTYVEYGNVKCILLENTNEQDLPDVSVIPVEPLCIGSTNYHGYVTAINKVTCQINGLPERNITPAQYISRNILFHNLKIHF